jgi:predicted deacylase
MVYDHSYQCSLGYFGMASQPQINQGWLLFEAGFGSSHSGIDYDADGKQVGALSIALPAAGEGWSSVQIPIVCIRNGTGPTLLLLGGTHGDEAEGPVVLSRFARELQPGQIKGRVIIIPALNLPAVEACERAAPVDGRDLNRCFPGKPDGSLAQVIAHHIDTTLLNRSDVIVDLHAGGRPLRFLPSLWLLETADGALWRRTLEVAQSFGTPLIVTSPSLGGDLSESTARYGAVYLSTEAGGGATVDPAVVSFSKRGIDRVMRHMGLATAIRASMSDEAPSRHMRIAGGANVLLAGRHGLFEPAVALGDRVERGQMIGEIHHVDRPAEPTTTIVSPIDGIVYGLRWLAHVRKGAKVAVIATTH